MSNKSIISGLIVFVSITLITIFLFYKQKDYIEIKKDISTDTSTSTIQDKIIVDKIQNTESSKNFNESDYKKVIATVFWVGEESDASNDYIPNHESYWDSDWLNHYGGIDLPTNRCGYEPCAFKPKENPFYFALPYGDRNDDGTQKESIKKIPWYKPTSDEKSIIKNHWVEIKHGNLRCYAQWEDVGPNEMDDFNYVFGNKKPKNTFGVSAGIDLSPAVWDCLKMKTNSEVFWRFVDASDVPNGPWTKTITTRNVSF